MFGIECRFVSEERTLVSDKAVATHLYRIAQEAVSNAIKHGKATRLLIRLDPFGDRVVLNVSDNGSGLPAGGAGGRGMGLRIMNYRASIIAGSLSIQNHSGGGASVVCSVPSEPNPGPP